MILSFLFVTTVMAATPCDGAKVGYWKNPDGTRGGSVASTAKVSAGVIIGPEAQVCGEAVVSGKTHIFGRAKISGKAKVHNSKICQASQINGFDVVDSDYYCQTEDPEPPHPGEAGKKTLLGIDSDQDGVRDDLEILINDLLSNTASKNFRFLRKELKQLSKDSVAMMKNKDNKLRVKELQLSIDVAMDCLFGSESIEFVKEVTAIHEAHLANTKDRNAALDKISSQLAGHTISLDNQKKSACRFK